MKVLGLMSGTSVDGIDVALAEITGHPALTPDSSSTLHLQPLHFGVVPWADEVRAQIFAHFEDAAPAADWSQLNVAIAEGLAQAALDILAQIGLEPAAVDLIGSHGQTLWHNVVAGRVTSTFQLGPAALIATRTGITTVGNFRVADVAAGGQGAPLVSTFDWHLLRPPPTLDGIEGGWRAVQNIGGIANVTFLPPTDLSAPPLAFDTGPGNALIDWAAVQATRGEWRYDQDGQLAAAGQVAQDLLTTWLRHPYFAQEPPKTTGRESFGAPLVAAWWDDGQAQGLSPADFVATVTELTAITIAQAYARFAPGPIAQVAIGGGGGRNPTLLKRLAHHLQQALGSPVDLCDHALLGYEADAKEAFAFALLAYFAIHGWASNIPACTGATRPVVLGEIAPGDHYPQLLRQVAQGLA